LIERRQLLLVLPAMEIDVPGFPAEAEDVRLV